MPQLTAGSTQITDVKAGSTNINEVYVGSSQVWSRSKTMTTDYYYSRTNYSYGTYIDTIYDGFSTLSTTGQYISGSLAPDANFAYAPLVNSSDSTPQIVSLHYAAVYGTATNTDTRTVSLVLDKEVQDSGWTTMTVGSVTFNRTSATRSLVSGKTFYIWGVTYSPFGSSAGTTREITFA